MKVTKRSIKANAALETTSELVETVPATEPIPEGGTACKKDEACCYIRKAIDCLLEDEEKCQCVQDAVVDLCVVLFELS